MPEVQVVKDGNKWILEKGSARIEYKDDGDGIFNAKKDTVVAQSRFTIRSKIISI